MLRYLASKPFPLLVLVLVLASAPAWRKPESPAIEPVPADGFDLIVVKKGTNEPVGDVVVSIVDITTITTAQSLTWFADGEVADTHQRLGRSFRTDEHGLTRLPFPVWRAAIRATHGDLVGERTVDAWSREELPPIRLELERDLVQRVKVVDAHGRACANVSVALRTGEESNRGTFTTARTGPDGIAGLMHVQRVFENKRFNVEPRVELDIHSLPGTNRGIALAALSSEPLELVLPDAGSVRVRVKGPHGSALSGPLQAYINVLPTEKNVERSGDHMPLTVDDAGVGTALFTNVGIGLELNVMAFPGASRTPSFGNTHYAARDFEGPKRAGEEIVVDIQFDSFKPDRGQRLAWPGADEGPLVATGIVRDPGGKPVPGATIRYLHREKVKGQERTKWNASPSQDLSWTDDDGRFDLHLMSDAPVEEMAVYSVCEGYVATLPLPFARGAKLEMVLLPEGVVCGALKVDPGANLDGLEIALEYPDPTEHTRWLRDVKPFGRYPFGVGLDRPRFGLGERFEWVGLPAGEVVVRIGMKGAVQPLAAIAGIEVVAGQVTRDPRLQAIDLRGKLPK